METNKEKATKKKVLVTGANGFIGAWLTKALINQGHTVRILKRENSDLSELKGLEIEHAIGDITKPETLKTAMKDIDSVFHLAGLVAYTKKQRSLMEKINVEGTQNIIDACLNKNIKRLVHFSSVTAVGASFDRIPLNEDSPYNIKHLDLGYFETKHDAEKLVIKAVNERGLDAVIVNPSTVYGPGDAKKGSRKTQLKVARGEFPVYTSGGVNIIYIADLVSATLSAWEKGKSGERYILSGENISIKKLFELIAKTAGVEAPKIKMPNFLLHTIGFIGDGMELVGLKGPLSSENAWTAKLYHWFDSSKAQKELGLNITPASVAIEKSVEWSKANGLLD